MSWMKDRNTGVLCPSCFQERDALVKKITRNPEYYRRWRANCLPAVLNTNDTCVACNRPASLNI